MNTSGDRLKALLQECALTPSDFAAQRNVTPQHVNNWFKRGVPLARLDEIADLFCVHRRWLRSGEGPKHPSPIMRPCMPNPAPTPTTPDTPEHDWRQVRILYHAVREGRLAPLPRRYLRLSAKALATLGVSPRNAVCLEMPGSNMAPLIPMDATLAIDRSLTQVIDGQTYALLHDGRLRVHSLSLGQNDTLCLHSHDRRNYAVERYTAAQRQAQGMQILGWVFWWSWFSQQRPG
ncbi:S24 family peptidase [Pseudomonas entomophila]|uniref:LexA family transcriptional regulator n=1 Tax=Pseudomonas entomophila TaxID=312306 RepID=UPI0023D8492D|nr:S24 family peptidase [Pseudomonas entomophila]MDF0731389.1 S24 family peptidase [Pseudomonas entomophila]